MHHKHENWHLHTLIITTLHATRRILILKVLLLHLDSRQPQDHICFSLEVAHSLQRQQQRRNYERARMAGAPVPALALIFLFCVHAFNWVQAACSRIMFANLSRGM
jgi:hypothetical protein